MQTLSLWFLGRCFYIFTFVVAVMSYLKGQSLPEDLSVVHLHLNLAAFTETQGHKEGLEAP